MSVVGWHGGTLGWAHCVRVTFLVMIMHVLQVCLAEALWGSDIVWVGVMGWSLVVDCPRFVPALGVGSL